MPKKSSSPARTFDREHVIPYRRSGSYIMGQRVEHNQFGLGTVIRVRHEKVVILFDADGKDGKARRFLSAKLNLAQRRLANGLDVDQSLPAFPILQDVPAIPTPEDGREISLDIDPEEAYDDMDEVA
jgi:hypothetical protein